MKNSFFPHFHSVVSPFIFWSLNVQIFPAISPPLLLGREKGREEEGKEESEFRSFLLVMFPSSDSFLVFHPCVPVVSPNFKCALFRSSPSSSSLRLGKHTTFSFLVASVLSRAFEVSGWFSW